MTRYCQCAVAAILLALAVTPLRAQHAPYHILLTNDDGIESPGLRVLADQLRTIGDVYVLAPCGQRSGASMSVALRDQLHVRHLPRGNGVVEHCVDTTPANAVMLAITTLAPEGGFDLVVSGINRGANVGIAAHMSGTVGAAMMGALYDIPAIAVSLGARGGYEYPARFVVGFIEEMRRHDPLPGVVFSINIPAASPDEIAGVAVARMGGSHLTFAYELAAESDSGATYRPRIGLAREAPPDTDTDAYLRGYISIAPLRFDWSADDVVAAMRTWTLSPAPAP